RAPNSGASPLARKPASSVPGIPTEFDTHPLGGDHRSRIRVLRQRSIAEPRNAFVWVDLALLYTTLGLRDQAARAIRIALALAPEDRFVLRCASRFLVHIGDAERAHHILKRSEATPYDPWLMAAEFAVSS